VLNQNIRMVMEKGADRSCERTGVVTGTDDDKKLWEKFHLLVHSLTRREETTHPLEDEHLT
jgi:hypothetical protein